MTRTWMAGRAFVLLAMTIALAPAPRARADDDQGVVETVAAGTLRLTITTPGVIEAGAKVEVRSAVGGVVTACMVDAGATVKKGDILFQLDDREAKLALQAARLRVDMRAADRTFAEERRLRLQAERERAGAGGTTRTAETELADAAAESACRADLERAGGELGLAHMAAEEASLRLEATRITAPMDGLILSRSVSPGEVVTGAAQASGVPPMCTIIDISRIFVCANLEEVEVKRVRVGAPASLRVAGYSRGEVRFEGLVQSIGLSAVTRGNGSFFIARIAASNAEQRLLPGMAAEATIVVEERQCGALIPKMAIVRRDHDMTVNVVVGDASDHTPKTERRVVQLGASDGTRVEVTAGLVAGERILIGSERAH